MGRLMISLAVIVAACGPSLPTPQQQTDEVVYRERIKACAEKSASLADSKACRAKVDDEWKASHSP